MSVRPVWACSFHDLGDFVVSCSMALLSAMPHQKAKKKAKKDHIERQPVETSRVSFWMVISSGSDGESL